MIYTIVVKNDQGEAESYLTFDSVSSYSESWSGTVSKSTVEYGFPIADHINIENPVFNISGVLSEYSIFKDDREIFWNGEDFVQASENDSEGSHLVAKDYLIKTTKEGTVITLLESKTNSFLSDGTQRYEKIRSGTTKEYDNSVITDLSFEVSENTQNSSIRVSMKIEQLNIARTETTTLTEQEMQKAIIPKVAKTSVNTGSSTTSTATDETGKPKNVAEKSTDVTSIKAKVPPEIQKEKDNIAAAIEIRERALGLQKSSGVLVDITSQGNVYKLETK